MRDLSDTVEMATLDKEMAEERVNLIVSVYKVILTISMHSVRVCRQRWRH